MAEAYCKACELEGRAKTPAHRMTAPPTCERHYEMFMSGKYTLRGEPVQKAQQAAAPLEQVMETLGEEREGTTMSKRLTPAEVAEIQRKREAGVTLAKLADEYDVSEATIVYHCKGKNRPTQKNTNGLDKDAVRRDLQRLLTPGCKKSEVYVGLAEKYGVGRTDIYLVAHAMEKDGGAPVATKPAPRPERAKPRKGNGHAGGLFLKVEATEELVDAEWQKWADSLSLEEKVKILAQRDTVRYISHRKR